jgi:DNA-binding winged helix-turn-helix (wHTH) protein
MKLRFGDVLFDGDARQAFRGADPLHLRGKAFELLRILIDQRPRALSKAELQEQLWPDTFVSEANLPSLIAEIREALGDAAHEPRYIATLHGFGYAFRAVATVAAADPALVAGCWLASDGAPIRLVVGENLLGRVGPGAAFDSPTVSRHHARIVVAGDVATIEDLGSKNGTFVNNDAVTSSRTLKDGDRIRVGSFLLTFRLAQPNASTLTESAS